LQSRPGGQFDPTVCEDSAFVRKVRPLKRHHDGLGSAGSLSNGLCRRQVKGSHLSLEVVCARRLHVAVHIVHGRQRADWVLAAAACRALFEHSDAVSIAVHTGELLGQWRLVDVDGRLRGVHVSTAVGGKGIV